MVSPQGGVDVLTRSTAQGAGQVKDTILLDSGACMHVCPKHWMSEHGRMITNDHNPALYTADGSKLEVHGRREVRMMLPEAGFPLTTQCVVCNVKRPILSVTRLTEKGMIIEFGKHGAILKMDGRQATARQDRGQFLLDVVGCPGRGGPINNLIATAGEANAGSAGSAAPMATTSPQGGGSPQVGSPQGGGATG